MRKSRRWRSAVRAVLAGLACAALLVPGQAASVAADGPGSNALPDRPFDENGTGWIYNYVHAWPGAGTEYRGEFPYMSWAYEDEGPGYEATRFSFITEQLNNGWYTDRGQSGMIVYGPYKAGGHWRGLTAIDHFDTDPVENGTLEEFRELVEAAHARGITVVTYIALIYMHHDNPLFLQAEQDMAPGGAFWAEPGVKDPAYDGPAELFLWDTRLEGGVFHPKTTRCGQWDAEKRTFDGEPCNSTTDAYAPPPGMDANLPQAAWWAWSETAQRWYGTSWRFPAINYFGEAGVEYAKSVVRFWLDQGVDGFEFDAPQSMWGAQASSNYFGTVEDREWVSTEVQITAAREHAPDKQLYLHAEGTGTYSNMVRNDRVGYTHVLLNGDNDEDSFTIRVAPQVPGEPWANPNGGTVTVDRLDEHWQAYADSRRMNGRGIYAWSVYNWDQPHEMRALDAAVQAGMGAVYSIDYQEYWTPNTTTPEPGGLEAEGEERYFDVFRAMKKSSALVPAATRERLLTNDDDRAYAVLRRSTDRSETVLALYNFDSAPKGFKVSLANTGVVVPQVPVDLATDAAGPAIQDTEQTFWLPPFGYQFLRVQAGEPTPAWDLLDSADPGWELGTGVEEIADATAYRGSRSLGTGEGTEIRLTFEGTALEAYGWKGRRASGSGALGSDAVEVYLDGGAAPVLTYRQHLGNVTPLGGWPADNAGLYNQQLFSLTGLEPGEHTLVIKNADPNGRPFGVDFVKVAEEAFTVPQAPECDATCVDTEPPVTEITIGEPEHGDLGPVTFELSASDDVSGVVRTEYLLDDGEWTTYTGPVTVSEAGEHLVQFRSTDLAGNVAGPEEARLEVVAAGDATGLRALVDSLAALAADGGFDRYTAASHAALLDALAAARAVTEVPARQATIDAAYAAVLDALDGLEVAAPDKTTLRQIVDAARTVLAEGSFTKSSTARLTKAIAAATAVLKDPRASEREVSRAITGVTDALSRLKAARPTVVKVKTAQTQLRLVRGKAFTLPARVYLNGAEPAGAEGLRWKSSRPKVATVSKTGRIKARKTGTTTITMTTRAKGASGKKVTKRVKVKVVAKASRAKVSKVTATVPRTMRLGRTAYVTGRYHSAKATGVRVTYATAKRGVVEVDEVGRLVAVSKGTDTVLVRAGGVTKKYKVTVR